MVSPREPRYYDVKRHLAAMARQLPVGSALPAERTLAAEFDTSRTTVRQAVRELVVEGRLTRAQGSGTFVARPKVGQSLELTSYTEEMRAQGIAPDSRLVALDTTQADRATAQRLGVRTGARVVHLVRVRLADGETVAVENTYLASSRFPRLARSMREGGTSLYEVLARDYGVRPSQAEDSLEAALATPEEAALLGVETGLPVLLLSQQTFDADGTAFEWVRAVYRGDRARLVARVGGSRARR